MRKTASAFAAAIGAGALVLGLVAAPPASAYPPGKQQKTELNKSSIREGGRFKAEVRNAQPGCRVTFTMVNARGREVASRTGTVGPEGSAEREFSRDTPRRPGTYTVQTVVSGSGCTRATSSAEIEVRAR